ncbi:hypothetical protein L249_8224 [Ophiocordyceps polyrhachis-furcata BCC 54312]|uniref:Uncharacterized protein n=1 Tax=Ophiocordyceps polyrhachis-furcata BCC 54312 TaxID=1330021 RepID=A0A367LHP6_9HYPO|nr:hypothetical protein L249_8224 [Ophiocordyceps polyrhachis-furcata BCC 54312]
MAKEEGGGLSRRLLWAGDLPLPSNLHVRMLPQAKLAVEDRVYPSAWKHGNVMEQQHQVCALHPKRVNAQRHGSLFFSFFL